jgi:hypothetical protein
MKSGFRSVTEVPVNAPKFERPENDTRKAASEHHRAALAAAIAKLQAEKEDLKNPVFEAKDIFKVARPPQGVVPAAQQMAFDQSLEDLSGVMSWATTNSLFVEGLAFLGYPYLSQLSQRPEYRVISETWAQEMTRKWIRLTAASDGRDSATQKADKITAIEAEMKRLKVQDAFKRCAELDGFFGRGHIYIELEGVESNDREELKTSIGEGTGAISKAKIKQGGLKGLRVVEPIWSYPNGYNANDPLKSNFFRPDTWFVMGQEIHTTRLLTFVGRPMPDLMKPAYSFGGLSLSQMAKPYVDNWLRTRQSVSDAVSNFSIMVLLTDMAAMLNEGALVDLVTRADFFNTTRDNRGLMLGDKSSEDLKNVSTPLSGLHELQAQSQEQMSSVSQIPLVKLTGISPSGLNASSEGEIKVFYDKVQAQQVALFNDNLTKVIAFVQLSLFGEVDPEISFVWEPLDTLDPAQEATRRKTDADTDAVYLDHGVLSPEEVRTRLASDDMSPYASLDATDVPEQQEEEGEETDEVGAPLMDGLLSVAAHDEAHFSAAGVMFMTTEAVPRVLLLKRAADDRRHPGVWDLPGGRLETGETPTQAAIREAREEAGASLSPQHLKELSHTESGDVDYTTFCAYTAEPFLPELSDEHDHYVWASRVTLPENIIAPLEALLHKVLGDRA